MPSGAAAFFYAGFEALRKLVDRAVLSASSDSAAGIKGTLYLISRFTPARRSWAWGRACPAPACDQVPVPLPNRILRRERAAGAQARFDRSATASPSGPRSPASSPCRSIARQLRTCRRGATSVSGSSAIRLPATWCARRPAPILRPLRQLCRDRVELDIADRRHQMRIVHRIAGESPLPQIAGPALAQVDPPRVAPVRVGQRRAQGIGDRRARG